MPEKNIGYKPEVPAVIATPVALPEARRSEIVPVKLVPLDEDDRFIARLPKDLTPEEIDILNLVSNN